MSPEKHGFHETIFGATLAQTLDTQNYYRNCVREVEKLDKTNALELELQYVVFWRDQ